MDYSPISSSVIFPSSTRKYRGSRIRPVFWSFLGFTASLVGFTCYPLSHASKPLFGEWKLWKLILYYEANVSLTTMILRANEFRSPKSLGNGVTIEYRFPNGIGYGTITFISLVLLLSSLFEGRGEKCLSGNILSLISWSAFALVSMSLAKLMEMEYEVLVTNGFLGSLVMIQLWKMNYVVALVGVALWCVFVYMRHVLHPMLYSLVVGYVNPFCDCYGDHIQQICRIILVCYAYIGLFGLSYYVS